MTKKTEPDIYDPFSTRIKRSIKTRLKEYCHKMDQSTQLVVNKAIDEYLKKREG